MPYVYSYAPQFIPPDCGEINADSQYFPPMRKTYGPRGANLFVNFLPKHYNEDDLLRMFSPFGSILSVTVYVDAITRESKCFGNFLFTETTLDFATITTRVFSVVFSSHRICQFRKTGRGTKSHQGS